MNPPALEGEEEEACKMWGLRERADAASHGVVILYILKITPGDAQNLKKKNLISFRVG